MSRSEAPDNRRTRASWHPARVGRNQRERKQRRERRKGRGRWTAQVFEGPPTGPDVVTAEPRGGPRRARDDAAGAHLGVRRPGGGAALPAHPAVPRVDARAAPGRRAAGAQRRVRRGHRACVHHDQPGDGRRLGRATGRDPRPGGRQPRAAHGRRPAARRPRRHDRRRAGPHPAIADRLGLDLRAGAGRARANPRSAPPAGAGADAQPAHLAAGHGRPRLRRVAVRRVRLAGPELPGAGGLRRSATGRWRSSRSARRTGRPEASPSDRGRACGCPTRRRRCRRPPGRGRRRCRPDPRSRSSAGPGAS